MTLTLFQPIFMLKCMLLQLYSLCFQLLEDDKDKKKTKPKSTGNISLTSVSL